MEYTQERLLNFEIIAGLKEIDENGGFFKEILDLYCEQYPGLYNNIVSAYSEKNLDSLSKFAHALKGASLNIGAKEVADICKNIELISKEGKSDNLDALIQNLDIVKDITIKQMHTL